MTGLVAAPMRVRGATAEPPPEAFTQVELIWIEKQTEHWIRFGRERRVQILDRRRRILVFPPGSVLALVRWAANEHGTVLSRLDILRTVDRDAPCQTVPTVTPGAEVLLHVDGWPKVERVLQLIDAIEALGIAPAAASPAYWRTLGNRLAARSPLPGYTAERHAAWLAGRSLS